MKEWMLNPFIAPGDVVCSADADGTPMRIAKGAEGEVLGIVNGMPGFKSISGTGTFVWTQSPASATWLIVHNLGKYPSVAAVDSTGRAVDGDVQYIDANNIQILFLAAFAGHAYLN